MTFRSRSCVIGRGVVTFSICSAMALASKIPTQIGSTRCPSLSRRMTIGVLVMGSTINPLIDISICIAACLPPDTMGTGAFDRHGNRAANPRGRTRHIYDDVLRRAAGDFSVSPPAGGVDEHRNLGAHERRVQLGLNRALGGLERHDPPRLLLLRH